MENICALFGVSRQAFYDAKKQEQTVTIAQMIVLCLVRETRQIMPLIGTRKLIQKLAIPLKEHGIKMGRDQLFELLRFHGLLVRRMEIPSKLVPIAQFTLTYHLHFSMIPLPQIKLIPNKF